MICSECGKDFEAKRADARFCSPACKQRAHRAVTDNGKLGPVTAKPTTPVTASTPAFLTDKGKREAMKKRADRLQAEQVRLRGTRKHWSNPKLRVPGPYVPSAENEARAAEIIALRRASNL